MNTIEYNDRGVTLGYKHVPIYASANAITGTRYFTEVFLMQGSSSYPLGQFDGRLDEEEIKFRFTELMQDKQTRQYGQKSTFLLTRKELTPVRERARGYGNLSRQRAR